MTVLSNPVCLMEFIIAAAALIAGLLVKRYGFLFSLFGAAAFFAGLIHSLIIGADMREVLIAALIILLPLMRCFQAGVRR